jgi:hypothetical protein
LEVSDCVPNDTSPSFDMLDAVSRRTEDLIVSTTHIYKWKNHERRGKALVYFDLRNLKEALEFCEVFQTLGYKTHMARISTVKKVSGILFS